jgi:hypothetical protein
MEEAKIGIGVDEFGRECWVLVKAMKGEPGMDLLKVLGFCAEVQEGRWRAERFCLGGGKVWEFEWEMVGNETP